MLAQWLIFSGAAVIGLLGTAHLIYTFGTNKFESRDEDLNTRLRQTAPVISRQTTMWRALVGFNASHSLGAMLFGAIYGYLSLQAFALLLSSWFLIGLNAVVLLSYLLLARLYWFHVPFKGISLAALLMLGGYIVAFAGD